MYLNYFKIFYEIKHVYILNVIYIKNNIGKYYCTKSLKLM